MIIRNRRDLGFTLLELLVVLAIAGLLVTVVPAAISAAVPGTKLKVATRDLALTLRQARSLAIVLGKETDVVIATEPAQYVIAGSTPTTLPRNMQLDVRGAAVANSTQFAAFAGTSARDKFTVRFYPDGSASGAAIKVSQGRGAYLVDVNWLMGSVNVTAATDDVY